MFKRNVELIFKSKTIQRGRQLARSVRGHNLLRSRVRQPGDHVLHHPGQDPREQDGIAQAQVHQARQVLLEPQEEEERFDLRIEKGKERKFRFLNVVKRARRELSQKTDVRTLIFF